MELLYKEETDRILGAAVAVHKTLGFGLREKTYERAMIVEFQHLKIDWQVQPSFDVIYRGEKIDQFIPDIIAFGKIIVEIKTIPEITRRKKGQVLNYLKVTGLKVGLILNFARPTIEPGRVIF